MVLAADAARDAIARRVAEPLGLGVEEAALGILRIAAAKMSLSVRQVSVERGHDPRDFAMTALGGAGPLHALDIARELHIPTVIVPRFPAQFCALGMLMTDIRHDDVRTHLRRLAAEDLAGVASVFEELAEHGEQSLAENGVGAGARRLQWWMDLRYVGQEFTLQTPVTPEQVADGDVAAIKDSFERLYATRYGHAAPDEPLEVVNLRITAIGETTKPRFPDLAPGAGTPPARGSRDIHLADPDVAVACAVYRREDLGAGATLTGPAVIEEYASTTVMGGHDRAHVAPSGEIIIEVGEAA
jgi:N-methylhydantoinase A